MKPIYTYLMFPRDTCVVCEEEGTHPREYYVQMYERECHTESVNFEGCVCLECTFLIERELDAFGCQPRGRHRCDLCFREGPIPSRNFTEIPITLPGPTIQKLKHALEESLFPDRSTRSYPLF